MPTATRTPNDGSFDEPRILARFDDERLAPRRWSNAAHDTYAPHAHSYHKVLYCLRGSITFTLTDSHKELVLLPGDRLEIPPGIRHGAIVGPHGVECIEAARA
jgi:quercetin dioxygenase-like cupin family protein